MDRKFASHYGLHTITSELSEDWNWSVFQYFQALGWCFKMIQAQTHSPVYVTYTEITCNNSVVTWVSSGSFIYEVIAEVILLNNRIRKTINTKLILNNSNLEITAREKQRLILFPAGSFPGKTVKMLTALSCEDGILYIWEDAFYLTETAKLSYDRAVAMVIPHFLSNSKMQKNLKLRWNSGRVSTTIGWLEFLSSTIAKSPFHDFMQCTE